MWFDIDVIVGIGLNVVILDDVLNVADIDVVLNVLILMGTLCHIN